MTQGLSLEELLAWNEEASAFWNAHFEANHELLLLPCDIGGNKTVQEFVRHIWGAELVWSQIIAGLPLTDYDVWPHGPLGALFDLHLSAVRNFQMLLGNPDTRWDEQLVDYPWRRPNQPRPTPRKALAHVLLHSQRHWAQLSTLVRSAGFPSGVLGDLLFSSALD
jgi:uncharacterized damage-inducible protein DinB